MSDIRIFIATHKDAALPKPNALFSLLGLGGYRPHWDGPSFSDADGDSIAARNDHYSEMTGWYWIWKNVTDAEIVGLCHYRRFFFIQPAHPLFDHPKLHTESIPKSLDAFLPLRNVSLIKQALSSADAIVPIHQTLELPISEHYRSWHNPEHWDLFIRGIWELFPDVRPALSWFDKTRDIHLYNMMIAKKDYVDRYLSFYFPLMAWIEARTSFGDDPYQRRVPAFLAERFFSFYLNMSGSRCVEVPVAITERKVF
jgi:hypothetical protein